jgi:hypothetical protein
MAQLPPLTLVHLQRGAGEQTRVGCELEACNPSRHPEMYAEEHHKCLVEARVSFTTPGNIA